MLRSSLSVDDQSGERVAEAERYGIFALEPLHSALMFASRITRPNSSYCLRS
jgi:hypothetical protein